MSRAKRAFEVSGEFGPAFGTLGDQRLFARKLPAFEIFRLRKPNAPQLHNRIVACATALAAMTRSVRRTRSSGVGHSL